jgi:hypothetical protein
MPYYESNARTCIREISCLSQYVLSSCIGLDRLAEDPVREGATVMCIPCVSQTPGGMYGWIIVLVHREVVSDGDTLEEMSDEGLPMWLVHCG